MVPVTVPGLISKAPRMLFDQESPLFLRWLYLPKLIPWLFRYLSHANDANTRRIARHLKPMVEDSLEQHQALVQDSEAADWVHESDYSYAYESRVAFEKDAYSWRLRHLAGFETQIREGQAIRDYEPNLSSSIKFLVSLKRHGYIRDPGAYVKVLASVFEKMGGRVQKAEIRDFEFIDQKISALLTTDGRIECDHAVIATGVWSKPLLKKLGINVPLESERGYHIVFKNAEGGPQTPIAIAKGKFVATPMSAGLRCAGLVEFGGLNSMSNQKALALLRRHTKNVFPNLSYDKEIKWLGHRPAPSDSLPLIGEIEGTKIYTAFGHHHIGLTSGPKTGRIIASLLASKPLNIDIKAFHPMRFSKSS